LDQDRAVTRIVQAFRDCPKPPLEIDRREKPSHGYRAVHVIVYEDSTPMEIQVRTKLQDTWAQISEKLGDIWGRGLRYGDGPDLPDSPAGVGSATKRSEVVEQMLVFAGAIDTAETHEVLLSQLREEMLGLDTAARGNLSERLDRVAENVATSKDTLQNALDTLLREIGQQEGAP